MRSQWLSIMSRHRHHSPPPSQSWMSFSIAINSKCLSTLLHFCPDYNCSIQLTPTVQHAQPPLLKIFPTYVLITVRTCFASSFCLLPCSRITVSSQWIGWWFSHVCSSKPDFSVIPFLQASWCFFSLICSLCLVSLIVDLPQLQGIHYVYPAVVESWPWSMLRKSLPRFEDHSDVELSDVFRHLNHVEYHHQWSLLFLLFLIMAAGVCCFLYGWGKTIVNEAGRITVLLNNSNMVVYILLSCMLIISLALSWRHLTTPVFTWVGWLDSKWRGQSVDFL